MDPKVYHKSVKTGGSDIWGTPLPLFDTLDREFGFTLDPCAGPNNARAGRYFTAEENGLEHSWQGERVFMNPPYSEMKLWASKAYTEALSGALVVCLVPARVGSSWFREYMAPGEVRFLTKRLKFLLPDNTPAPHSAGFDSAVVVLERGRGPATYYWDWEKDPPPGSSSGRARPALRYYGSKFQLAPWVINHFPGNFRELHYIEPYGGSAGVLLRKAPSFYETYNDLDGRIVTFFRVLRERARELIDSLRYTPYAREEYEFSLLAKVDPAEEELEIARLFFIEHWQGMTGSNSREGWKVQRNPNGRYSSAPQSFTRAIGNLYRIADRLREVQIENINALDLIRRSDYPESLFYVDPPYLGETRSAPNSYQYELTEADHRELSETLRGLSGYVLLSGYKSDLYAELYGAWGWTHTAVQSLENSGKRGEEVLWSNPRLAKARGERGS